MDSRDAVAASPNPKLKRPCYTTHTENSTSDSDHFDALLESLLHFRDSSAIALDLAVGRIVESCPRDSEKQDVVDRALRLGSALTEAAKRSARRLASMHNAAVWALPSDLTIKVFSLLDTQSVCHAAATCSFFNKCAADPLCYANINLTTTVPRVNNVVVSTMIQRAGKVLRSLKLGIVPSPPVASLGLSQTLVYSMRNSSDTSEFSWNDKRPRQGKETFVLTRSCLAPLISDGGAPGALLKKLHLYNIERMDNAALGAAISACPSLLDLEIVGLHVELRHTLESVSRSCPLIGRLYFESSETGRDDSLTLATCNDIVNNCPYLSSLALRGFKLHDRKVRDLVKGLRNLKFVDFTMSYAITGEFLRYKPRWQWRWKLTGSFDFTGLYASERSKELKVSRTYPIERGLHLMTTGTRDVTPQVTQQLCSFMSLRELLEERPNLKVHADFPAEGSFVEEPMTSSDVNNDTNSPSGEYAFTTSSESSYNSDHSSGNEDYPNAGFPVHDESSDEVDDL
ncbi:hypothetical protein SASPL_103250 [Salvia splendens]|uniref:F-box domain-containing protein n=1 Tax=Salvia splendens TaxID=180675 RepID=A0A8X9ADV5_SALSN|nr:hypothetical protein SASPL_103250 [Salvia splendens]